MKELTFREYISIIRKRKWWIISFVIIIPIAVLFITSRHRVLIYEAETTIKLTPGMPIAPSVGGKMTWWKMTFSTKTEAEVIKGTKIIEKAARVIGIISADMPTEEVARISKDLVGKIKTNAVENTGFITIKVRDSDAHFVAVFANELAKSYIEEHILEKNRESIKVRQFLEQQLAEKELALAVAEKEYKDYQEENADFFALASAYKSRMELIDQDISRLTEIYTPEHRKVKALQKEANKIRKKLKLLPQKEQEMSGMEEEIAADKVLYNKIKEELMEAKISESAAIEDVSIVNAAVIPLSPVNPSTRINIIIGIIAGLILGFIFVFVSESLDTSISTIGEIESYLSKKVLGVIPYIKANRAGGSTSKGVSNPDKSGPLLLNESTESALFEAWKMIAMNINFAIKTNPINSTNEVMYSSNPVLNGTTLMLTSTVPNEGKTISSINLAITNAYSGKKTLLVDLDTKRPHLHRIFNTSREPGFIEFMMGRAKLNEVVKGISHLIVSRVLIGENILKISGMDNLSIMSCGHKLPNIVEILNSDYMKVAIEELKKEYEVIIFDSTPILATADASMIADKIDYTILVYEVNKVARLALKRTVTQLSHINANILGLILNKMKAEDFEPEASYYYSYKYHSPKKTNKVM